MTKSPTPVAPKKESTNFKLDPRLKYIAELASRHQRRNLTNYVEWAIESSFDSISMDFGCTMTDAASDLWDVDESERFLKLALRFPELLTYEEQIVFKVIVDNFNYLKKEKSELSDSAIAIALRDTRSFEDLNSISIKFNQPKIYFFSKPTIRHHWEDIKSLKPFYEWSDLMVRNGYNDVPF